MKDQAYVILVNGNRYLEKIYSYEGEWYVEDVCSLPYAKLFTEREGANRQMRKIRKHLPLTEAKVLRVKMSVVGEEP